MNQIIEIINKVMAETNDPDYFFKLKDIKEQIESILPIEDHDNVNLKIELSALDE